MVRLRCRLISQSQHSARKVPVVGSRDCFAALPVGALARATARRLARKLPALLTELGVRLEMCAAVDAQLQGQQHPPPLRSLVCTVGGFIGCAHAQYRALSLLFLLPSRPMHTCTHMSRALLCSPCFVPSCLRACAPFPRVAVASLHVLWSGVCWRPSAPRPTFELLSAGGCRLPACCYDAHLQAGRGWQLLTYTWMFRT